MSEPSYRRYRKCAICGANAPVHLDEEGTVIFLFKYSTRHYAHAGCLAMRRGTNAALARLPDHEHAQFRAAIRDCDEWTRAAISVKNKRLREVARRVAQGGAVR